MRSGKVTQAKLANPTFPHAHYIDANHSDPFATNNIEHRNRTQKKQQNPRNGDAAHFDR
jgi:hypothetical protein